MKKFISTIDLSTRIANKFALSAQGVYMEIKFCGGAYEVGASCIMLEIAGKNILLDCGIRMTGDTLPNLSLIKESGGLDLILVSHAHMDHIGALPIISGEFPNAPIIMTHMTKELVKILLYDSLKIMDLKETEIPIFSEIHVENMMNRILCYSPNYDIYPFLDDFQIRMYSAGHIPGAVFFYLITKEGSFFYSGDFSMTPQMAVGGAAVGKLRPDVAILESTYGGRLHSDRGQELSALLRKIEQVVESGHKILIPAFALGRAQEIILYINNAFARKSVKRFPVYVDGMVNDICRAFVKAPNYLRERYTKKIYKNIDIFYNDSITAVSRSMAARKEIAEKKEGACIIASSGMLTGGPSAYYAAALCEDEDNYIALTGYQDEESPGAKLLELARGKEGDRSLKIGDAVLNIKCGIGIYGLSAHADKSEILALAHALSPKQTFFVHGSEEALHEISASFQRESRGRVTVPQNGDAFSLDFSKNKRKQMQKDSLRCLGTGMISEADELKPLWEFILLHYGEKKGYPAEDLSYILTGNECTQEEYMLLGPLLHESKYFTAETKRPYIFHAVLPEDIPRPSQHMEVNQALELAGKLFAPYGLYKKGAKFQEKIIVLYFNFPRTALKRAEPVIKEFEEESNWTIQVNEEIHVNAAEELIEKLLAGCRLTKNPSYHRPEMCFRIVTDCVPENYRDIEGEFLAETGINLHFTRSASAAAPAIPPRKEKQAEQNAAFSAIDRIFAGQPDKLYKKSLKVDEKGAYMELGFLSPELGNKYREELCDLEAELGWRIEISPTVNQNEVFKIGKGILQKNGLIPRKGISYHPDKKMFAVQLSEGSTKEAMENAKQEFEEAVGLKLETCG